VAGRLAPPMRRAVTEAILAAGDDALARTGLDAGLVDRFVPIGDRDYDDIRAMMARSIAAGLEGFGPELGCTPATATRGDKEIT
jgi:ABC-type phosphate/phosphonate transport system substrate-binding protein